MESLSDASLAEDTAQIPPVAHVKNEEPNGTEKEGKVLEFFIFQGKNYHGWNCFQQERVTVGKSEDADLVLNGRNISDIHAFFLLKDDQILVSDENMGSGIIVNGKFVSECVLKPHDQVTIGPFTLKVKIKKSSDKKSEAEESEKNNHRVYKGREDEFEEGGCLASDSKTDTLEEEKKGNDEVEESLFETADLTINEEQYFQEEELKTPQGQELKKLDYEDPTDNMKDKTQPLEDLLAVSEESITDLPEERKDEVEESLFETADLTINEEQYFQEEELKTLENQEPKDLDCKDSIVDLNDETQGFHDQLTAMEESNTNIASRKKEKKNKVSKREMKLHNTIHEKKISKSRIQEIINKESGNNPRTKNNPRIKEEKKDNSLLERPFSLKDNLAHFMHSDVYRFKGRAVLEVVKCRGKRIVDICSLKSKEKYFSANECGRFCLAENKDSEICYFYFNDRFEGKVQFNDNFSISIKDLCLPENLYGKKENFYRRIIPVLGFVSINDGYYDYYLGMTIPEPDPEVLAAGTEKSKLVNKIKHLFQRKSSVA